MRKLTLFVVVTALTSVVAYGGEGIVSGNQVGFLSIGGVGSPRRGKITIPLGGMNGVRGRLKDLIRPSTSDIELQYRIGTTFYGVISDNVEDGSLHWYDTATCELADEWEIATGTVIYYRMPDRNEAAITFSGEVIRGEVSETETVYTVSDTPRVSDLNVPKGVIGEPHTPKPDEVACMSAPPSRFVIRTKDGTRYHVMWDYLKGEVLHYVSGAKFDEPFESIVSFEVDDGRAVPECDRMDSERIRLLAAALQKSYRDRRRSVVISSVVDFCIKGWHWLWGLLAIVCVQFVNSLVDRATNHVVDKLAAKRKRRSSTRRRKT